MAITVCILTPPDTFNKINVVHCQLRSQNGMGLPLVGNHLPTILHPLTAHPPQLSPDPAAPGVGLSAVTTLSPEKHSHDSLVSVTDIPKVGDNGGVSGCRVPGPLSFFLCPSSSSASPPAHSPHYVKVSSVTWLRCQTICPRSRPAAQKTWPRL